MPMNLLLVFIGYKELLFLDDPDGNLFSIKVMFKDLYAIKIIESLRLLCPPEMSMAHSSP